MEIGIPICISYFTICWGKVVLNPSQEGVGSVFRFLEAFMELSHGYGFSVLFFFSPVLALELYMTTDNNFHDTEAFVFVKEF